jgi:multiple sugar transport system substrate-binding protein
MTVRILVAFAAACASIAAAGCGGSSGGSNTVNWYVFQEPSGAYNDAVANCNKAANGRYKIVLVPLPTSADQQRELVVRRLAAKDSSIDIIGQDVIWTAEFASARWILPWTGQNRAAVTQGTLLGPIRSGTFQGKLYAAPFTSNVQFLWYRKDRVKTPPKTWDQMIAMAKKLGKNGTIEIQGARYEGLVVWFNTLINSAGGTVVNAKNQVSLGKPAVEAATVMAKFARSGTADPNLSNSMEDTTRLAFQAGGPTFMLNWPYVFPSAKTEASPAIPAWYQASPAGSRSAASTSASRPTRSTPSWRSTPPSACVTRRTKRSPHRRAACRRRAHRSTRQLRSRRPIRASPS